MLSWQGCSPLPVLSPLPFHSMSARRRNLSFPPDRLLTSPAIFECLSVVPSVFSMARAEIYRKFLDETLLACTAAAAAAGFSSCVLGCGIVRRDGTAELAERGSASGARPGAHLVRPGFVQSGTYVVPWGCLLFCHFCCHCASSCVFRKSKTRWAFWVGLPVTELL